ncbi:MAG: MoxR family ATPase [Clostridiales bacterium]|nr:MoxR family ATPase [Clostridiales bacterium]MBQ5966584.1 MoxR family ATPase [Clostridiales bacterium]MBQ6272380.1 MoxR family ATPase [Clostridiales bacterium]MBR4010542.1 MoxR family ATPase [Clostridiales bacterium]MCR5058702.1 MoxR family ATPase [Clostridiales bacterium]
MREKTTEIVEEIKKVICGKDEVIRLILQSILAGGHVLMEDVPGVGKTTMALSFAKTMGLDYGRVQFTPDVLPSDITGFSLLDPETRTMKYQKGAVFHNLFLADELNRASSRTQSALLEAMEEGQVTVDDKTYPLPKPFVVIATQNPSGASGTTLLPDSQMDRFAIRVSMGYPSLDNEIEMLTNRQNGANPLSELKPICSIEDILQMQEETSKMYVKYRVMKYIVALMDRSRNHKMLARGGSPRCTLALTAMAKAHAYMTDRDYVIPDDVKAVFPAVLCHRMLLTPEAEFKEIKTEEIAKEIIKTTLIPKE